MMYQKKGDLSMSTIVMAVIAVLILIVLASMVINNLGDARQTISACESVGGQCFAECNEFNPGGFSQQIPQSCRTDSGVDSGLVCCIR